MPHLHIDTNLPRSKIPADFATKAIPVIAKILDRPAHLCVLTLTPDVVMSFGGSTEPSAISRVIAIERFSAESNKNFAKVFFEFIQETLGIPSDRMYLSFEDVKNEDIGYKGVTIAEINK